MSIYRFDVLFSPFWTSPLFHVGHPWWSDGKVCLQYWRPEFNPWVGKICWRRKWQPTPVFLPGKSHGWRSMVGYSPWGCKKLATTEQLTHVVPCMVLTVASRPACRFLRRQVRWSAISSMPFYEKFKYLNFVSQKHIFISFNICH